MPMARPAAAGRSALWLYGASWDVLLGYGLAYLLSVPVLLALTSGERAGDAALQLTTVVALLVSLPHYGATLLRVYERRNERRRYAVFTVWATLAVWGLFLLALYEVVIGSILVTIYVMWGIWHFSAQNYGIAVLYLRRSGVETTPQLQRPLHASFLFSALLAILAIHVAGSEVSFASRSYDPAGTFRIFRFGIGSPLREVVQGAVALGYVGSLAWAFARLRGDLPVRRLGPIALLLLTQALWYSIPAFGTLTGSWASGSRGYAFAAVWISIAHAAQYLWVSTYYAERSGACDRLAPYLGRCMLAGAAITAPGLLFAPGLLGGATVHSTSIVILVFAVLNIHHFLLDGAIWRLREGRVASLLVRSESAHPAPEPSGRWPWGRAVVYGLGMAVVFQQAWGDWALRILYDEAKPIATKRAAANDLYWLGLDSPKVWLRLASSAERSGSEEVAIGAYRNAIATLKETSPPWAANRLTWLLLRQDDPRLVPEATRLARFLAHALGDTRPEGWQTLAAALAAGDRWDEAAVAAERALAIARARDEPARVREIESKLLRYQGRAGAPDGRLREKG